LVSIYYSIHIDIELTILHVLGGWIEKIKAGDPIA